MKSVLAAFIAFIAFVALGADRTTVYRDSSVRVIQTELRTLADGGCTVQAWAEMTSADGGVTSESSATVEVGGANRAACLDVQAKALVLFKQSNGF